MDEALLAAYRASTYRVRLRQGGVATIRIDRALPNALQDMVGESPWSFVTAWNPYSQPLPREINRRSQRSLLAELQVRDDVHAIRAAVGVGADGWHEPSLFVIGPDRAAIEALAGKYRQYAYLHGDRLGLARLCWVDD
jgi:Protein of unknown function (DUF3293)